MPRGSSIAHEKHMASLRLPVRAVIGPMGIWVLYKTSADVDGYLDGDGDCDGDGNGNGYNDSDGDGDGDDDGNGNGNGEVDAKANANADFITVEV